MIDPTEQGVRERKRSPCASDKILPINSPEIQRSWRQRDHGDGEIASSLPRTHPGCLLNTYRYKLSGFQNNHIAGTSSRETLQKSSILQSLQLVALLRIEYAQLTSIYTRHDYGKALYEGQHQV